MKLKRKLEKRLSFWQVTRMHQRRMLLQLTRLTGCLSLLIMIILYRMATQFLSLQSLEMSRRLTVVSIQIFRRCSMMQGLRDILHISHLLTEVRRISRLSLIQRLMSFLSRVSLRLSVKLRLLS